MRNILIGLGIVLFIFGLVNDIVSFWGLGIALFIFSLLVFNKEERTDASETKK